MLRLQYMRSRAPTNTPITPTHLGLFNDESKLDRDRLCRIMNFFHVSVRGSNLALVQWSLLNLWLVRS